ncbi:MYCBP-associated protein family-domain-containing protein [Globomyces pollinis-pini]|nr:MYCBP-associated protein family-domain-containing protein [Globomyces pollinis-pini]
MLQNNEAVSPKRFKKVILAKEISSNSLNVNEPLQVVPLSLFDIETKKMNRNVISKHSILGDWDDFQEFEKRYKPPGELEPVKISEIEQEEIRNSQKILQEIDHKINLQKKQEMELRKERLNQMHIFQRYQDIREEHALQNWKRHSVEWNRMEQRLVSKSQKSSDELLMARLGEYRMVVEEKTLIEEALHVMEDHQIDFWKEGIRIGSDLLGLSFQPPIGGQRQLERLRTKQPLNHYPKKSWIQQQARKKELGDTIKSIDPFYKHGGDYLETTGINLSKFEAELTKSYIKRLEKLKETRHLTEELNKLNKEVKSDVSEVPSSRMVLMCSSNRLVFEVTKDKIASSILTIHNRGTYVVHFEWVKTKLKNPLKITNDNNTRFFFTFKKGTILPGTAYDFPIVFKSSKNGIFTEQWTLNTSPKLPTGKEINVTLQGIAFEVDLNVQKRRNVDKLLESRIANTLANEIITKVMTKLDMEINRRYMPFKDTIRNRFESQNKLFRLNFNSVVYEKLKSLSNSVFAILKVTEAWNGSVTSLYECITMIPNESTKTDYITELNDLVKESTNDNNPGKSTLLSIICTDMLVNIASKIVDISDDLRKKLNLTTQRSSNTFFDPDELNDESEILEMQKLLQMPETTKKGAGGADAKRAAVAVY